MIRFLASTIKFNDFKQLIIDDGNFQRSIKVLHELKWGVFHGDPPVCECERHCVFVCGWVGGGGGLFTKILTLLDRKCACDMHIEIKLLISVN